MERLDLQVVKVRAKRSFWWTYLKMSLQLQILKMGIFCAWETCSLDLVILTHIQFKVQQIHEKPQQISVTLC